MSDEFKVVEANFPVPEQAHLEDDGRLALARLITDHIRRGLESGTWTVVNGRAIPVTMLHFYRENDYEAESHIVATTAATSTAA